MTVAELMPGAPVGETTPKSTPPLPGPLPSIPAVVRMAVDALEEAGGELRTLSAAVVLFGAAAVGIPLGSVFVVAVPAALDGGSPSGAAGGPAIAMLIALAVGIVALVVLIVQIPLLVIATVGARLAGQPISLRQALRRSRQVFLKGIAAAIVIGLLTAIPTGLAQAILVGVLGTTQLASGLGLGAGAVVASPWVYVLPGIVLGGVGVSEAFRRSWRIARLRWRIAVTIALLGVIGQFIVVSAAGTVLGAITTVLFVASNGADVPTSSEPLAQVAVLVGTLVVGASLVFGVQLVQFAPQASGFFAMTGYTAGLDAARGGTPEPLFQRRALVFYAVGITAGIYVLARGFLSSGV